MIRFDYLRQYTQIVDGLRFVLNPNNPYMIFYFSENSTFYVDYPKCNFKLMDVRNVIIPITVFPRSKMTQIMRKKFKDIGLLAYQSNTPSPKKKSIFYDASEYFKTIDTTFRPTTYRQRSGSLIHSMIDSAFIAYPDNYKKVLIYSVDLNNELKPFVNRKSFPLVQMLKDGNFNFDHLVLLTIKNGVPRYRLLVKNREFKFEKVFLFLKNLKHIEEVGDEEIDEASDVVLDKLKNDIEDKNKSQISYAVKNYLKKDINVTNNIVSKKENVSKNIATDVATSSILYTASNKFRTAKTISKIPSKEKQTVFKNVQNNIGDQLLIKEKAKVISTDVASNTYNIPKMVDEYTPSHLFEKRKIDFQLNLKNDMTTVFKNLESRDIKINLEKIDIVEKKKAAGELEPSDLNELKVVLSDEFGKKHNIKVDLPKIDYDTGTFRVNGRKKCLINQIVLNPIYFLKKNDAKFQSSFSTFHIISKRTKKMNYLYIHIGTYKLPLLIFLAYGFGFEETLKNYGISYKITDKKPPKTEKYATKINENQYIIFDNVNSDLKRELCQSFLVAKVSNYNIKSEFPSSKYFTDLIIAITGRVQSTYRLNINIQNVVDPIAKQVLVNQQLPFKLDEIIKYMSEKVITDYVQQRNDISNQRIRNSEILVHLLQKQILSGYNTYREQVLSGNKDAKFEVNETKVLSQFINSEVVVDMEYANPIEEMATLTRITPVGKSIGGIEDREAISTKDLNVHDSYYGNIDPMDTPEGANIGVVQQLAIGADITTARGMFHDKGNYKNANSSILSTSSNLVPFIECTDGARVMMYCSQCKQFLPLKDPEPPAVQTGYESVFTKYLSSSFVKKSPVDGKITQVTTDHINVLGKDNKSNSISLSPVHLKSGSGHDTLSVFKPTVRVGQTVKKDTIVAEGSGIFNGTISMGRNLCVAMTPYMGYNFEDGVILNESVTRENKLISLHGSFVEEYVSENDRVLFISDIGKKTEKGEIILRRTVGDIEKIFGVEDTDEDTEISAGQIIKRSPGGVIVDIEVFCNVDENKFSSLKPLIDRTKKKYEMEKNENFKVRGKKIDGLLIRFKIEQELVTEVGDKLSGRYGNKGIICLIEKEDKMPITPWGERIEAILNPIGIVNRMNIGQLYELYCGLISRKLASVLVATNNKQKSLILLKRILPYLDVTKNKLYSEMFIDSFSKMPNDQFSIFIKYLSDKKFFPIVIPPFKNPGYKQIKDCMKVLGLDVGYNLYLPAYKTKTVNKVPIGYMYLSKLEHIAREKLHARSTGPVAMKTRQPLAGKRREGGQAVGELDSYAYISYNCPAVLAEMFGPLSDDHVTKNEIISEIVSNGSATYKEPKTSPVKELLMSYLIALMLQS